MDVGVWFCWDFCSSVSDWSDGCSVRDSDFTTSVSNSKQAPGLNVIIDSFFCRVLTMMIILGTIWFFVPKKI